ncbi:MAG: hypothetical protein E6R03_00715 [Hyphomicrobiaceae bacterium]|nr:MAG: hypothetical protein E6R03_00715 [Hyphomicrobiaceae bacterium]
MKHFVEEFVVVSGISANTDIFNGNPISDVVNVSKFARAVILFSHKGGTTGNGSIKVQAVDNVAGSNAANLPFRYSKKTTGASDTWGAITDAVAADGVTTVATEDTTYAIEVDLANMPETQKYLTVKLTEVTNDPVSGSLLILLGNARYGAPFDTVLT